MLPEEMRDFPVANMTFAVEEILKGQPETQLEGTINVQSNPVSDRQLVQQVPTHRHLLFLFYTPSFLERLGRPLEEQNLYRYDYMPMHGIQAVIRDISGTTRVLDARNPNRFPAVLEGLPFDVVVETVRQAAPLAP